MPENHPLLCDGAVKASEGEGDLSSCAAKMGDGAMGVGVSGIVEWNSSSPLVVAAVFTAVLERREGLIYAHFNMTANTSSPVSSLSGAPARRERKKEREERVMAADMLMTTKCHGDGPRRTCGDSWDSNF